MNSSAEIWGDPVPLEPVEKESILFFFFLLPVKLSLPPEPTLEKLKTEKRTLNPNPIIKR